ncbi:MAG: phage holin family protein [Terrimesophilobacter sp.]
MIDQQDARAKRSLFSLIGSLPTLISDLIKAELDQFKTEISTKAKAVGIGLASLVVASVFGFFAVATLIAAAVLGIAVALPAWLAALIVAVALLIVAGIVAFLGVSKLKAGSPPTPTDTIGSVKKDVRVITGTVKRGES